MPANKFHRAKLTLYFLQLKHHRSEEPRGPGPVCPCRTPVTSTSPCRLKFCTWPFLEWRLLLRCCIVTGAHASTRKQRALWCPGSSILLISHIVRLRYTAWLVTWPFRSDFVRWLTVIFVSASTCVASEHCFPKLENTFPREKHVSNLCISSCSIDY